MARPKDAVAEVKRIRAKVNARLMAAHRKGRLDQAIRELERDGDRALHEAMERRKAARRRKRA